MPGKRSAGSGWIGVDLDGVLAIWHQRYLPDLGPPIPLMIARVNRWLAEGMDVRIFTARVQPSPDEPDWWAECHRLGFPTAEAWVTGQRDRIDAFCEEHFGRRLPITAAKDWKLIEVWDDRCVQMEVNTGRPLLEQIQMRARELKP